MTVDVWSWFWSSILVDILRLIFSYDFKAKIWSKLWGWSLVKILRLKFGRDFKAEEVWSRLWDRFHQDRCTLIWWKNSTLGSVVPLATSYFFLDCSGVEACCQIPEQEIWIKGCKWDEKKTQFGEILILKLRKRKLLVLFVQSAKIIQTFTMTRPFPD